MKIVYEMHFEIQNLFQLYLYIYIYRFAWLDNYRHFVIFISSDFFHLVWNLIFTLLSPEFIVPISMFEVDYRISSQNLNFECALKLQTRILAWYGKIGKKHLEFKIFGENLIFSWNSIFSHYIKLSWSSHWIPSCQSVRCYEYKCFHR